MRIIQNGYNQKRNAYDQTEFFICTHNYHPLHRILGMGGSSSSGYPGKYIFLRICSGDFGSVGYISYNVKDPVLLRGLHIIAYVFIYALKAMFATAITIAHSYYTR